MECCGVVLRKPAGPGRVGSTQWSCIGVSQQGCSFQHNRARAWHLTRRHPRPPCPHRPRLRSRTKRVGGADIGHVRKLIPYLGVAT